MRRVVVSLFIHWLLGEPIEPKGPVDRFAWARALETVQICKYTQVGARAEARVVLNAPLELNVS